MEPYADGLADGPHRDVPCYDCHVGSNWRFAAFKTTEMTAMYPRTLLGQDEVRGPIDDVPSAPCAECHEDALEGIVGDAGLRIRHETCTVRDPDCETCHTAATHADAVRWPSAPVMEECVACHRETGAPTDCDACHEGRLRTERLRAGPWQVTHGPTWEQTHGMGTFDSCATCHPDDYCVDCHGTELPHPPEFGREHSFGALAADARCDQCHSEALCDGCHGIDMPHPEGFLAEHPELTSGYDDPTCVNCHDPGACTECHVRHTHPGSTDGTLGTVEVGP
jgi:hypothetical protein